jgi:hypothetical protein
MRDQNTKTSKRDYIKHSLLNFLLKRESLLIEYQLEEQLFETIRVYEQKLKQEKLKEAESKLKKKEITEIENYTKGTLTECLKGINMMIQNQGDKVSKEELKEGVEQNDKDDHNIFLKNSGSKDVRSPEVLRSSRNNVILIY